VFNHHVSKAGQGRAVTVDQGVAATEKMKSHSLTPISHCYISYIPTPAEIGASIIVACVVAAVWMGLRRRAERRKPRTKGA
jgi:hypothetical protein